MAGKFNIIFAGTMGRAQALDAVLKAASIVAENSVVAQFVFVGGGIEVERLKKIARENKLWNVLFLPRRNISEMGAILAMADVLLVHLKDDQLFTVTIPSKIQAYLAAGRPILLGVKGDAADLVEKSCAGLLCEPENPVSIAAAVGKYLEMSPEKRAEMGKHGELFYQKELSLAVGVKSFDEVFKMLLGNA